MFAMRRCLSQGGDARTCAHLCCAASNLAIGTAPCLPHAFANPFIALQALAVTTDFCAPDRIPISSPS
ncbi:hypothetical protein PUN4_330025 [Paraburkholderia unamae]|nr:hypothetical protein PUN4_330025 [Paraburkholderia unamae]